jgi:23S rRNA (guanosine2251-2'-O)-methyltransferase
MERSVAGSEQIEGVRAAIEAIRAARRPVLEVWLPSADRTPGLRALRELAEQRGIPVREGREVRARAEPFPEEDFEDLLTRARVPFLVALDRVTDVGNLGAIARSAECAGVGALVLEHRHAPPIGAGALRASAGALEHLRVGRTPNLRAALALARREGYTVAAGTPDGVPVRDLATGALCGDLIWVFGSEDRGLRPGILEVSDLRIAIPLHGQVESLGVAAAAAVLLHRTAEERTGPRA